MRQIKFRAWNPQQSRLISWEEAERITVASGMSIFQPSELVWQQFTGLTDKNRKEIYEGDIVAYRPTGTTGDGTPWKKILGDVHHEVIFEKGAFRLKDDPRLQFPHRWEVIGNIYENPELLAANSQGV
jgi:uncharacterized phage protein (TIGR01671 family)